MPRHTKATGWQKNAMEFFRGGGRVPDKALRQFLAALKRDQQGRFDRPGAIRQQAAKLWNQIESPASRPPQTPRTKKALDALLGIHKKLASQRPAAPRVLPEVGGILAGSIWARITPPFDFADTIPTTDYGNPVLAGFGNRYDGLLSSSAITDTNAASAGSMYAATGVYFRPIVPGTLQVSASPSFSFEWWTNSLSDYAPVVSWASGALVVYGIQADGGVLGLAATEFKCWDQENTSQVLFDFGSSVPTPVSVQLSVDPSLQYMLFVRAWVHVEGMGWHLGSQQSLAGSVLSVTVPSLTYQFTIPEVSLP